MMLRVSFSVTKHIIGTIKVERSYVKCALETSHFALDHTH